MAATATANRPDKVVLRIGGDASGAVKASGEAVKAAHESSRAINEANRPIVQAYREQAEAGARLAGSSAQVTAAVQQQSAAARIGTDAGRAWLLAQREQADAAARGASANNQAAQAVRQVTEASQAAVQAQRNQADATRQTAQAATVDAAARQQQQAAVEALTRSATSFLAEANRIDEMMATEAETLDEVTARRAAYDGALQRNILTQEEYLKATADLDKQEQAVQKAMAQTQAELDRIVQRYDPASAAIKRLAEDEEKLTQARARGAISAEQYDQAMAGVAVQRARWTEQSNGIRNASNALEGLNLTSREAVRSYVNMMQQISAGDWAGLNRSLISAASNTGALRVAFVALLGVAAAVVAALAIVAVGMVTGYRESQELERSLVATGHAAGVTGAEVQAMAADIGEATGEFALGRQALAALATGGKVAGEDLERAGLAAVAFAQVTGSSAADAAASIQRIAEAPTAAIAELDRQYNFLTASTYSQIRALEEEGREADAARLAYDELSRQFTERAARITENLGFIERGWRSVKGAAASAWDAMLNLGRAEDPGIRIGALTSQLAALEQQAAMLARTGPREFGGVLGSLLNGAQASAHARGMEEVARKIAATRQELAGLNQEAAKDTLQAQMAATQRAGVEAIDVIDRSTSALDRQSGKQRELMTLAKAYYDLHKANPADPRLEGINFNGPALDMPVGPGWDKLVERIEKKYSPAVRKARDETRGWADAIVAIGDRMAETTSSLAADLAGPAAQIREELRRAVAGVDQMMVEAAGKASRLIESGANAADVMAELARVEADGARAKEMYADRADRQLKALEEQQDVARRLQKSYEEEVRLSRMSADQRRIEEAALRAVAMAREALGDAYTAAAGREAAAVARRGEAELIAIERTSARQMEAYERLEQRSADISQALVAQWRGDTQSIRNMIRNWIDQLIAEFLRLQVVRPIIGSLFSGAMGGAGGGMMGMLGAAGSTMLGNGASGSAAAAVASGGGTGWGQLLQASTWSRMGKQMFGGFSNAWSASMAGSGTSMFGSFTGANFVGPLAPGQAAAGTFAPSAMGYGMAAAGGLYAGYNRWQNSNGGAAGAAGAAAYGVGAYSAAMGGMAVATGGLAAGAAAIPVIGWVALVAMVVDMVAGGKLFGTAYRPESVSQSIGVGADGGTASVSMTEVRNRSMFQGRQWRTGDIDPGNEMERAAQQMFRDILGMLTADAARMTTEVGQVIEASINTITTYDKKGRETGTKIIVEYMGRQWEEETAELAAIRLAAEARIAQVGEVSGQNAIAIAERWRDSAEMLAEGAEFLVGAWADINRGRALLTEDLGELTDLVESLRVGSESLADTYQRLFVATDLLEQALSLTGNSLDLSREEFISFAADIANAAGGIERAQQLWSSFFANYYGEVEMSVRQLDQLLGERNSGLESIGLDPGASMAQFRDAFEAGMSEMTAQEIARWLEVGDVLAQATQAQQQYALAVIDTTTNLQTIMMGVDQALGMAAGGVIDWQAASAELADANARLIQTAIDAGASEEELARVRAFTTMRTEELAAAQANAAQEYAMFVDSFTDAGGFRNRIREIQQNERDSIRNANELARAAGMQGAAEQHLTNIHRRAAAEIAVVIRELETAIADIAQQLYGGGRYVHGQGYVQDEIDDWRDGTIGALNEIHEAWRRVHQSQLAGLQRVQDYLVQMQFGGLSALSPTQQLDAARAQIEALRAAHLAGDPDAAGQLPQAVQTFLQLLQGAHASGSEFSEGYEWVRALLQEITDAGPTVDDPGTAPAGGVWDGYPGLTPDALRERDEILATQEAAYRAAMAQSLVEHVAALAQAQRENALEVLDRTLDGIGTTIQQLVTDLGGNLNDLGASTVQIIADMARDLGVPLVDLVTALDLQLPDLADGVRELAIEVGASLGDVADDLGIDLEALAGALGVDLDALRGALATDLPAMAAAVGGNIDALATALGLDLGALTTATVGQLAGLAGQLNTDLTTLAGILGTELGELTDVNSPIYTALTAAIGALPEDQASSLQTYLEDIAAAAGDEERNHAVAALRNAVLGLPVGLRNQLTPFFEGMDYGDLSDLGYLATISADQNSSKLALNSIRDHSLAARDLLERVASNLQAANVAADIPAFARGGWVNRPTTLLAGERGRELILDNHTSEFLVSNGIPVNVTGNSSVGDAAAWQVVAERLQRIEDKIEAAGNKNAEAVSASGRGVEGAIASLARTPPVVRGGWQ